MALAGCAGDETVSGFVDPTTEFALESISGSPFAARATITFPGAGKVLGEAPCNRWSAAQTATHPAVNIENILSTKRFCPDQALEDQYFDALRAMSRVEATGNVVILSDGSNREMVFRAQK
ncbi:META domain-containing protein [Oceaniglobus ichthyenteri]|uniref:META domain-containing protein n=1 Tax=Oceaniglobus ichthyenteri TaxID=2136177 RepID=UPI000D33F5A6|nr:META domain-containing protein [Oceaniglobus ichthyenteri]